MPQKTYIPSRPVHVLHVIGLFGVGKTRFLKEFFPTLPVFDIKLFDREQLFSSEDLKHNPTNYLQYTEVVRGAWENFLRDKDPREDVRATFCVGVESSGENQALNVILVSFFPTVLLIHGDPPPMSNELFWTRHSYNSALNDVLRKKLATKAIPYTHLYDTATGTFSSILPREFCMLSPQLAPLVPKIPIQAKTLLSPRTTRCPTCGALFFTLHLFTMHQQRHITHLKKF